jgi:glycosyltransferase involved in cell wall biosynthesis
MSNGTGPGGSAPRVSVVIPAYNGERYLGATLDGVLNQSIGDWEVVVFDDGSGDASADIAASYAAADNRIHCVRGPNQGPAQARNRGFAATDGHSEFVIFLDHDDVWEPDTLERLVDALDARPGYVSAWPPPLRGVSGPSPTSAASSPTTPTPPSSETPSSEAGSDDASPGEGRSGFAYLTSSAPSHGQHRRRRHTRFADYAHPQAPLEAPTRWAQRRLALRAASDRAGHRQPRPSPHR